MPDHAFTPTLGLLDRWSFDSPLLANRLGDPTQREVLVHIPPEGVEAMAQGKHLGVVIYLAPFTPRALLVLAGRRSQKQSLNATSGWSSKGKWTP